jgi:hypothetical protein
MITWNKDQLESPRNSPIKGLEHRTVPGLKPTVERPSDMEDITEHPQSIGLQ